MTATHRVGHMCTGWIIVLATVFTSLLAGAGTAENFPYAGDVKTASRAGISTEHLHLPMSLVENRGQWDERIRYGLLRGGEAALFLRGGIVLSGAGEVAIGGVLRDGIQRSVAHRTLSLAFVAAARRMTMEAIDETGCSTQFYLGNDSSHWVEGARSFVAIRYRDVWNGIDVEYEGEGDRLRQCFILHAGARGSSMRLASTDGEIPPSALKIVDCRSEGMPMDHPTVRQEGGILSFSGLPEVVTNDIVLTTEFSTYFGGSGSDIIFGMDVDSAGTIYVAGTTSSLDLPLANAWQGRYAGDASDIFVAAFTCDGRSLHFCTYLGGSGRDTCLRQPYYWSTGSGVNSTLPHLLLTSKDNALYMYGTTNSMDFPVTISALQHSLSGTESAMIISLSSGGTLLHGTYLGCQKELGVTSFALDAQNNVYVFGVSTAEAPLWFITANTVQSVLNTNVDNNVRWPPSFPYAAFLLKMTNTLSDVVWGTYFYSLYEPGKYRIRPEGGITILVDSQNNPVIIGIASEYADWNGRSYERTIPLVNALYDNDGTDYTVFVTKLNAAATQYVFSSYYAPNGLQYVADALCDANNNIIVTGIVSKRLIAVNAVQSIQGGGDDAFLMKVSPTGALLTSTYLGGPTTDYGETLAADRCGNILLAGHSYGRDFVFVNATDTIGDATGTSPFNTFLSVFDNSCTRLLRSTYLSDSTTLPIQIEGMYSDEAGYLTCMSSAGEGTVAGRRKYQMYNSYQDTLRGKSDGMLTRFRYPTCEPLSCALLCPDSVRVERRLRYVVPGPFAVRAQIVNVSGDMTLRDPRLSLSLPAGIRLDPPSQDDTVDIAPSLFLPGMSAAHTFTVRIDSPALASSYEIGIRISYRLRDGETCPEPYSSCAKTVALVPFDEPQPRWRCEVTGETAFRLNAVGGGFENSPLVFQWTLTNPDTMRGIISKVVLEAPADRGVTIASSPGTVLPGDTIAPGGALPLTWTATARAHLFGRSVPGTIRAYDRWDSVVSACAFTLTVPECDALPCRLEGPETVRYDSATGRTSPDTLDFLLTLSNVLDTAQTVETTEALPSPSGLLYPVGASAANGVHIPSKLSGLLPWRYRVRTPLTGNTTDTIVVRYRTTTHPDWRQCSLKVRVAPEQFTACALEAPDNLSALADTGYAPNPFTVTGITTNTGPLPAVIGGYELTIDPAWSCETAEQLFRPGTVLAPGTSDTLRWTVTARALRTSANGIDLSFTARNATGEGLLRCARRIGLPPLAGTLRCSLSIPDTMRYDPATDTWAPDPFAATLALTNTLDTAHQNVETEINLSSAPHVVPDSGETTAKRAPDIGAHARGQVAWRLRVTESVTTTITETVRARYRGSQDTVWRECVVPVVLAGGERIVRAACAADGCDTVWADIGYETVIPQPVQVWYTITNTGNIPLSGCTAAIVLPDALELLARADSIQVYDLIAPGESATRRWMLRVAEDRITAGTRTIQWQSACPGLVSDPPCERSLAMVVGSPAGIVLGPRWLRFEAERNGALPSSQQVGLWTGGSMTMPWAVQGAAAWLDCAPSAGDHQATLVIRPNTTALAEGVHVTTLGIASAYWVSPQVVMVEYAIGTTNAVERVPVPGDLSVEGYYPSPARGSTTLLYRMSSQGRVTLTLYDVYGRSVLVSDEGERAPGHHAALVDANQLPSGVYVAALESRGRLAMTILFVRH